jgi:hypothetical protein
VIDVYYIQVRDKETGAEYPIPLERYQAAPDLFTKLNDQPLDPQTGAPLPVKPKTSVDQQATKKATAKTGQKAVTQKENS